jgi:type I restriction enzyme S subunit
LKITDKAILKSATQLLPKGTVLLSITRHLRPTILGIDACANQSVVGIKENGLLKSVYLYPYIKNEIPRFMSLRTGAQQPHINIDIVDESLIIVPTQTVLEKYNEQVSGFYESIMYNAKQSNELRALRDWLLPMLMTGQAVVVEKSMRDR